MPGENLYATSEASLHEQAVRTVREIVEAPEATEAAYGDLGFDATAHAHGMEELRLAWGAAMRARTAALSLEAAAHARLAAVARARGFPWIRRLRTRLASARRQGVAAAADVVLPRARVRANEPRTVVAWFRAAATAIPSFGALTPGSLTLVEEGTAHARELDQLATAADAASAKARGAVREAEALEAELIRRFRELDGWADEAVASGVEVVPGRSRDVLRHHAATR